jgi:hypothetical protein
LQRLEQFLVYADDSKRELATVNLLVQRNIPVTFGRNAVDVINDTIDPDAEPRIMKAIPVHPLAKNEPATSKARPTATPAVRKAIPLQKPRKD